MTDKETLEHEIKVLEEAEMIMSKNDFDRAFPAECAGHLRDKLAELTKPKFKDGTLGRWYKNTGDMIGPIIILEGDSEETHYTFHPLPIETILRHLAPEDCDSWKYASENSIYLLDENWAYADKGKTPYRIPAPYREDWENVGGEL